MKNYMHCEGYQKVNSKMPKNWLRNYLIIQFSLLCLFSILKKITPFAAYFQAFLVKKTNTNLVINKTKSWKRGSFHGHSYLNLEEHIKAITFTTPWAEPKFKSIIVLVFLQRSHAENNEKRSSPCYLSAKTPSEVFNSIFVFLPTVSKCAPGEMPIETTQFMICPHIWWVAKLSRRCYNRQALSMCWCFGCIAWEWNIFKIQTFLSLCVYTTCPKTCFLLLLL